MIRLGKKDFKFDKRTAKMAKFLDLTRRAPVKFDFDKDRAPFKTHMWGNDRFGDCVFAGQMNQLTRLERVETRRTMKTEDQNVIDTYMVLTGCRNPGDQYDNGYAMLDAFSWWRRDGWTVDGKNYKIDGFGQLDSANKKQLRLATYLLHGIELGFMLPLTAEAQTAQGYWDFVDAPQNEPGSWGGHAVYAKKYDAENFYVLTWGHEVRVTNAFIEKYCDEAWAVVDSLDAWRKHPAFDVAKFEAYLDEIGATRH